MTDKRMFTAHAHTEHGEVLSLPLFTVDGRFPEAIHGSAFPGDKTAPDATFILGRKQNPRADTAEYYLGSEDPARRSLWQRLRSRYHK